MLFYAGLLLFFLLFGIASYYYPWKADDYHYLYAIIPGDAGYYVFSEDRIASWKELAEAIYNHRFMRLFNGRLANSVFQVHQYVCGGGRLVFSVLNVLALSSALYLVQKLCWGKASVPGTALSLLLGCLFVTDIATVFWMAASVNYLWGCTVFFVFLLFLKRVMEAEENSRWRFVTGLGSALVCGWWHEAMGVALCSGMVILYVLRRGKCSRSYIWYGVALLAGSLLVFSRGMFARMDDGDTAAPIYRLMHMLYNCKDACLAYLSIPSVVLLVSMFAGRFNVLRRYKDDILLSLVPFYVALCIAFGWKGSCDGACGFFYPVLLLLLLALSSLAPVYRRIPCWLSLVFVYACCAGMAVTLSFVYSLRDTLDHVMALRDSDPQSDVIVFTEADGHRFLAGEWFYPLRRSAALFKQVGPSHGRGRFYMLINRHPQERGCYATAQWQDSGVEGFSYCKNTGNLVIRFPRDQYDANAEKGATCFFETSHVELPSIRWNSGATDFLKEYRPDSFCSYDCDDAYFYLILPGMAGCSHVDFFVTPKYEKENVGMTLSLP